MTKPHSSCLEGMCNLWIDGRVVPCTSIIQTVARIALVLRYGGSVETQ